MVSNIYKLAIMMRTEIKILLYFLKAIVFNRFFFLIVEVTCTHGKYTKKEKKINPSSHSPRRNNYQYFFFFNLFI